MLRRRNEEECKKNKLLHHCTRNIVNITVKTELSLVGVEIFRVMRIVPKVRGKGGGTIVSYSAIVKIISNP